MQYKNEVVLESKEVIYLSFTYFNNEHLIFSKKGLDELIIITYKQKMFCYILQIKLFNSCLEKIKNDPTAVLIITTRNKHGMAEQRRLIMELINFNCKVPLIIYRSYKHLAYENLQIFSATDTGAMFIDGLGDGIFISTQNCGTISEVNYAYRYLHSKFNKRSIFL